MPASSFRPLARTQFTNHVMTAAPWAMLAAASSILEHECRRRRILSQWSSTSFVAGRSFNFAIRTDSNSWQELDE
jgi:hypothetical protein